MLARALLVLAASLTGFGILPRYDVPTAHAATDVQILRLASVSLKHHTAAQALRWLRAQPAVRSARWGADGRTLDIRFRDGMRSAILPARLSTARIAPGAFRAGIPTFSRAQVSAGRAVVLEPFATQLGLGPNVGDVEVNDLRAAGFQVDQAYDTAVSVRSMVALSQYNVVYMQTHSGLAYGGEGVLATGEPANGDPAVAPLVQNGAVMPVAVSGGGQVYYAITSRFILLYEGQFPSNSLVFFNGCNLLSAPVFWQALRSRNVGVLVSWDEEATSQDNYFAAATFFTQMNQGMNVASAIAAARSAGYGVSHLANRGTATLGYLGDGTITLQRAGGSAPTTPTPTPTSTPTPNPATPTATPTATPIPLPLTVTLKATVAPGTRQVLSIRSSPDTILHIRVTFPNGDQLSGTTATDPSGVARFSFTQRASKIMHGHRLADVSIQALKNGATATLTKSYRVKFGAIDVAAQPRRQAAGRLVTIWVHTRARTAVNVAVRVPSGNVTRSTAVSGPAGWVHFRYRIGVQVAPGSVITVSAQARIGGAGTQGQTTITVT